MHEKGINHRGDALHQLFLNTIKALTLNKELKSHLDNSLTRHFEISQRADLATIERNTLQINELKNKKEKLEEYLIDEHIDIHQYKKWVGKLQQQKASLQQETDVLKRQTLLYKQDYRKVLIQINNIEDIFNRCHFSNQLKLIRKIFQAGLSFDGKIFRISYVHPAFVPLLDDLATKGLLLFESPTNSEYFSPNQSVFDKEKIVMSEQELASFIAKLLEENMLKIDTQHII